MKKILSALLVVMIVLSLGACGSEPAAAPSETAPAADAAPSEEAPAEEPAAAPAQITIGASIRKYDEAHQLNRGSVDYLQKKFFSALACLLKERDEAEGLCRLRKPVQK